MIPRIVFAPTLFILASRGVTLRGALTSCELPRVSPCDIRKAVVRNVATPGSCLSFMLLRMYVRVGAPVRRSS